MRHFSCSICSKHYRYQSYYKKHLESKNHLLLFDKQMKSGREIDCLVKEDTLQLIKAKENEQKRTCRLCGEILPSIYSKNIHIRDICSKKIDEGKRYYEQDSKIEELKQEIKRQRVTISKLRKELSNSKQKAADFEKEMMEKLFSLSTQLVESVQNHPRSKMKHVTNKNNTTNNTTINFTLTKFGEEDIGVLSEEEKDAILTADPQLMALTLIGTLNLNQKYPQNHNLHVPNLRTKNLYVFDGHRFGLVSPFWCYKILEEASRKIISLGQERVDKGLMTDDLYDNINLGRDHGTRNIKDKFNDIDFVMETIHEKKDIVEKTRQIQHI